MSKKFGRYRTHVAALAVAVGLGAAAAAFGPGPQLVIIAPTSIVAGNNINGYATGLEDPCVITGKTLNGALLGPPVVGAINPLWFSYPTLEPMAPGCALLRAADSDESASASCFIQ